MPRNIVSSVVLDASQISLNGMIELHGVNSYTLGTNFISWGESNAYNLSTVAENFGTRCTNKVVEVVGGSKESGFSCGEGIISAFDFGLLYSVFTAMIMAKVELGRSFPIEQSQAIGKPDLWVLWLGNDAVLYSVQDHLILPIKNADIERACMGNKLEVVNFSGTETYTFERENNSFCLMTMQGEMYTTIRIPDCVKRTYSGCFNLASKVVDKDYNMTLIPGSMLGKLIEETDTRSKCLEVLDKYKESSIIDSIVSREDLIINPTDRYQDTSNFFGSICYTDKEEIAIAVNFRKGLFVFYPWFSQFSESPSDIKVDPSAKFSDFYNVTEGCNRILRYSDTVVRRPLTAAQLDLDVFDSIKKAFLDMDLARIPLQSSFGRIIIPENILVQELTSGVGESLYCLLPVGVVGSKLICITAESKLVSVKPSGWDFDSAFYDITEVVS